MVSAQLGQGAHMPDIECRRETECASSTPSSAPD